jgi:hypothetical protein
VSDLVVAASALGFRNRRIPFPDLTEHVQKKLANAVPKR